MKNDDLDSLWYNPLTKAGRAIPMASPDLNVLIWWLLWVDAARSRSVARFLSPRANHVWMRPEFFRLEQHDDRHTKACGVKILHSFEHADNWRIRREGTCFNLDVPQVSNLEDSIWHMGCSWPSLSCTYIEQGSKYIWDVNFHANSIGSWTFSPPWLSRISWGLS